MKYRLIFALLALAMILTGCSSTRAGRAAARAGERVEAGLDAVEDTVESAARRMLPDPAVTDTAAEETEASGTTITAAQAENIALKHVCFTADQVQWLRTDYEIDNGVPQYDVEFHHNGMEYEFWIHARTGDIMSFDTDPDHS